MGLIVQKYGGTSVADLERIRNVAKRIAKTFDQGNDVVAILSAMAKSAKSDKNGMVRGSGVLEVLPDGFGFLRVGRILSWRC